ncbi:DUF721 domain-containing protein [Desulfogranum marinum]|uniref:DUF721 domain-containing protein n=1 Tax=Desulfogranum marinum TaxID=453220 RepID=UPI0029C760AC|nr:DUF721 domain-containing protein [Desulfogranum marinum]
MRTKDLKKIYSTKNWHNQWALFYFVRNWENILGYPLGKVTYPAFFRGDVLWIYVDNSAWMQQMQYVKMDLLDAIQKAVPTAVVNDLRFAVHPAIQEEEAPSAPPPKKPIDKQKEKRFVDMVSNVSNEQCRQSLYQLWRASAGSAGKGTSK